MDRRLIYGHDEFVTAWVAREVGSVTGFGPSAAVGISIGGKLVAGLVWHDYRPQYGSIQMSIAALPKSGWCSREVMEAFFIYPFQQLQCKSVYVCVRRNNKRSRKFVEKVGFRYAGLLRRGFGTVDAVLYDMTEPDCRWLRRVRERQPLAARGA